MNDPIAGGAATGEFSKGWKPLVAALLGVACGAAPLPHNVLPLVMGPIHRQYGWDFTVISAGFTVFGIIASLLAPLYGRMADRFGVRRVAISSLVAFILVFASFWFVPGSIAGWLSLWAMLGLVGIGSTALIYSRAISMWFAKNLGLALGIMLVGTSLAALVVPQVATRAIAAGGWRLAFPVVALLPLLIALPVALLWFREPNADERPPSVMDANGRLTGLSFGEAVRGRRFWTLFASILVTALAYGGAHIHIAEIVALHGFLPAVGASALGIVALGIFTGRILVGLLLDRFWAPAVAFPAMLLPAIACFLLMGTTSTVPVLLCGAFLLGFAAGAESDVIAFFTARYFGMANYGTIYGALYIPFGIGSAISPILYGGVRDLTGSYDTMLGAAIAMFVVGGALLPTLGRYPVLTANPGR